MLAVMARTAAYLRISRDDEGSGLGIERQREAVTALAESKGWRLDPHWVIVENSVSAWDDSKVRPGFERLLDGMADGRVQAVVTYSFDRLARRLRDAARVIDLVEKRGVKVATVTGGLDLSTAYGRGIAGVLGSLAGMEIASMSERLKSKAQQNARHGRVTNGGRRPFGYSLSRTEVVEAEAAIVREVADRLIAGESLSGLVADLNRRGVGTAYGARWTPKKLRATMSRPALCGRVTHRGTVLHDVKASWPAILTPEQYDQVQIALAARRRINDAWTTRRTHLLSGLCRCGLCPDQPKMVGFAQTNGRSAYVCSVQRHLTRDEQHVDRFVLDEVKRRAAERSIPVAEWSDTEAAEIARQIADLEARKHDAARRFVDGSLPADVLTTVVAEFDERIAALREQQVTEHLAHRFDAVTFDLTDIDDLPLDDRRTAIEMYVQRVVIHPAKRKGRGFDPSTVEIVWKDLDGLRLHGQAVR